LDSHVAVAPLWPLPLAFLKLQGCDGVVSGLVKSPALFKNGSPSLWASCFLPVLDNLLNALYPWGGGAGRGRRRRGWVGVVIDHTLSLILSLPVHRE